MARGKRGRAREEASEEEAAQEAGKAKEEEAGKAKEEDAGKAEVAEKAGGKDKGEAIDNSGNVEEGEDEAGRELLFSRCKSVLQVLMDHKHAYEFKEPVDPVALEIPDYPSVIKHPMDLGTILGKLDKKEYADLPLDFIHDVRLTFDNAMLYNPPGHDVHSAAKKLLAFFEKEWNKSASKSAGSVSTPRTPRQAVSAKPLSFEEKQMLLENLQTLPPHMQHAAVLMMRERSPHVDWSGDDVDVQLDLLDNQLLQELEEHVKKGLKSAASSDKKAKQALGSSSKARSKGKQRKGKGKEEEEEEEAEEIGFVIDVPVALFPAQKAK